MPLIDYDRPTRTSLLGALIAGGFVVMMSVAAAFGPSTKSVEAALAAGFGMVVTVAFLVAAWLYKTGRRTRTDVWREVEAQTIRRRWPLK